MPHQSTVSSPPEKTGRRRALRWATVLLPLASILIFFLLLEGGLALIGVKPSAQTEDPFVGFADNLPLYVPSPDGQQLVTAANKTNYFNTQSFPTGQGPRDLSDLLPRRIDHLRASLRRSPVFFRLAARTAAGRRQQQALGGDQCRRHQLCQLPGGSPDGGAGQLPAGSVRHLYWPQRIPRGTHLWPVAQHAPRGQEDGGPPFPYPQLDGNDRSAAKARHPTQDGKRATQPAARRGERHPRPIRRAEPLHP